MIDLASTAAPCGRGRWRNGLRSGISDGGPAQTVVVLGVQIGYEIEVIQMLRQITRTYSLLESNDTQSWIAPAGPEQFLRDLASSKLRRWAATGSFASSQLVSISAPAVAVVHTDDPERLADTVRLRPTRTGGNVVTALPYDQIVFERTWEREELACASLCQVVVDCLTGFGRMPQEGDALLTWMRQRAPKWQAPSLTQMAELP